MSGQNTSKDSFGFYLNSVAERVDGFIGIGASKEAFVKHVNKVIAEAKKYKEYLWSEYNKAKANNRIEYDEQADKQRLWYPTVDSLTSHIYFTEKVQFRLTEELKPDPLEYLIRMASGAEESQIYKGLDLIDYQFTFLAIIHDEQRWGAGNERFYFDIRDDEAMSPKKASFKNRIGIAVSKLLLAFEGISTNYVTNTHNTIKAALRAVEENLWNIEKRDKHDEHRDFGFGEWKQRKRKSESQTKSETDRQEEYWHNDDFTEVAWNGQRYTFNKTQARVVEYLWANKRASEKSIGEYIESANENYRLRHTFRQKKGKKSTMHRAWGTMIVKAGKGIYALSETKKKLHKK